MHFWMIYAYYLLLTILTCKVLEAAGGFFFFFLSLVIVTWCYVWIYIHHFICCGRRPTALHDRGRDSDDDDYQNRDYDVAALANNLSQAFRYGIYSNDDVDEVPFKFFSKNSVQLITFFFLGGGGGQNLYRLPVMCKRFNSLIGKYHHWSILFSGNCK